MKKHVFTLALLSLSACASKVPRNLDPSVKTDGGVDPKLVFLRLAKPEKIDATKLKGTLNLETLTMHDTTGAMLKVGLGNGADYISYSACTSTKPSKCVSGKTATLGEPLFDLPAGKLKVSYQACALENRVLDMPCGMLETSYFVQVPYEMTEKRESLIKLTKLSREIQAEAFNMQDAAKKYDQTQGDNSPLSKEEQALIANLAILNPYQLGLLYESPHWEELKKAANEAVVKNQDTAEIATEANSGLKLTEEHPDHKKRQFIVFGINFALGSGMLAKGLWDFYELDRAAMSRNTEMPTDNPQTNRLQRIQSLAQIDPDFSKKAMGASVATIGGIYIILVTSLVAILSTSLKLSDEEPPTPEAQLQQAAAKIEARIDALKAKKLALNLSLKKEN